MMVHLKLKKISSFKAVTRKQSFLCRAGRPACDSYILVFEGEKESTEQVRERLARLDSTAMLCEECAVRHGQLVVVKGGE